MARFKSSEQMNAVSSPTSQNVPFQNVYGVAEGSLVYINMEAVSGLQTKMTTQKDMYVVVDISGSMSDYYKQTQSYREEVRETRGFLGLFPKKETVRVPASKSISQIQQMLTTIIDSVAPFDDDGVDVLFFSNGLVHQGNVANANEVADLLDEAMQKAGAFRSTMPTDCFKAITKQMREKNRPAAVFFLTDGAMDDGGKELKNFYKNTLHTEFKTRDQFYCYAIEFGDGADGALDVLDGLYEPEQGPEDLFDKQNSSNIKEITDVLRQVGAMSAIGSNDQMTASVDNGAVIDMVNADLIEGGKASVSGAINQVMSYRVVANKPFNLTIQMNGYEKMVLKCTPRGMNVDISVA